LSNVRLLKPWEHDVARTEKLTAPAPHEPEKLDMPYEPKTHDVC
jgi:hypothetical protein